MAEQQPVVYLKVVDPLLPQAEAAAKALGARVLGRTLSDSADGTIVLHLAMPDAPAEAVWIDLLLTEERQIGQGPNRWISGITYLDGDHHEISRHDVHVTMPITLDQIPEPLRGSHRH